jgi:hypothetical protein
MLKDMLIKDIISQYLIQVYINNRKDIIGDI